MLVGGAPWPVPQRWRAGRLHRPRRLGRSRQAHMDRSTLGGLRRDVRGDGLRREQRPLRTSLGHRDRQRPPRQSAHVAAKPCAMQRLNSVGDPIASIEDANLLHLTVHHFVTPPERLATHVVDTHGTLHTVPWREAGCTTRTLGRPVLQHHHGPVISTRAAGHGLVFTIRRRKTGAERGILNAEDRSRPRIPTRGLSPREPGAVHYRTRLLSQGVILRVRRADDGSRVALQLGRVIPAGAGSRTREGWTRLSPWGHPSGCREQPGRHRPCP